MKQTLIEKLQQANGQQPLKDMEPKEQLDYMMSQGYMTKREQEISRNLLQRMDRQKLLSMDIQELQRMDIQSMMRYLTTNDIIQPTAPQLQQWNLESELLNKLPEFDYSELGQEDFRHVDEKDLYPDITLAQYMKDFEGAKSIEYSRKNKKKRYESSYLPTQQERRWVKEKRVFTEFNEKMKYAKELADSKESGSIEEIKKELSLLETNLAMINNLLTLLKSSSVLSAQPQMQAVDSEKQTELIKHLETKHKKLTLALSTLEKAQQDNITLRSNANTKLIVGDFKTDYHGTYIPYQMHQESTGAFNPRIGQDNDATRTLFETAWQYENEKKQYFKYYLHALDGRHADNLLALSKKEPRDTVQEVKKAIAAGHLARMVVLHSDSVRDDKLGLLKYNFDAIRLIMKNPKKAKKLFFNTDKAPHESLAEEEKMGYATSQQNIESNRGQDNKAVFKFILDLIIRGDRTVKAETKTKSLLHQKGRQALEVTQYNSDPEEQLIQIREKPLKKKKEE